MNTGGRPDLLALDEEALAALTNRGLVKRAARELAGGAAGAVTLAADGTVAATHADGVSTAVPPGGLGAATCSCDATGVCRHVLLLVLAYQQQAAAPGQPTEAETPTVGEGWSPGEFTDEELLVLLGSRALASARRTYRTGYAARVRRPSATDPVPRVELPSCTVRFLVPHQLGYAHSDAVAGAGLEPVALAVWACRAADQQAPGVADLHVEVGGAPQVRGAASLDAAAELAGEVLLDGVAQLGTGLHGAFAAARKALDAANLRWPELAVEELVEQLDAYRDRHSRYRPELVAELLAEVHARYRAANFAGAASPRSRVLGTEEATQTQLRRARLTGLGARVGGDGDERSASVYLADDETGAVLVLHQRWTVDADAPPTGPELARRKVSGSTLGALAAGTVVTESAVRSASRRVRLAGSRIARTTVTPSAGNWGGLPGGLVVGDLNRLATELDALPPRLVRPRIEAETVRIIALGEVTAVGYDPAAQRLKAAVTGAAGGTATIVAGYHPASPAALDCLATVLSGESGTPRYLSGTVRRTRGGIVVSPIAVVAGDRVVVPDLADARAELAPEAGSAPPAGTPAAVLDGGLGLLAELAHRGARQLPTGFPDRLRACASDLAGVGLRRCAADLHTLADRLGPDPAQATVTAWVDAQIRLLTTADQLGG